MSIAITYLIAYLTEALIAFYYLHHVFQSKRSSRSIFSAYVLAYSLQYIFSFSHIMLLNTVSFVIMNLLLILYLYDTGFFSAVFHCLIMTIMMGISELLTGNLLGSVFFDYNAADFRDSLFITYFLISKILYFTLLLFIRHSFIKEHSSDIYLGSFSILLTIMPILSIVIMSLNFQITQEVSLSQKQEYYIITSSVCILLINILIFWLFEYIQSRQKKILQLELELQSTTDALQYNKILEQQDEEQKILIHDIKRHLQVIQTLTQSQEYAQLEEYINKLLVTPSLNDTFKPSPNEYLNLLLSRYISLCKANHIEFRIDAQNTKLTFMEKQDMTAFFCNLIDNAIESACSMPNAMITLKIADKKSAFSTIISCTNSCRTAPVSSGINLFLSQKPHPNRHGIGMRSIKKIVRKYNGTLETYYQETEKTFHTIIVLQHND